MALFTSHPDRQIVEEKLISSSWSTVLSQAAGRGESFIEQIEKTLADYDVPNIIVKRQELVIIGAKQSEPRVSLYVGSGFHGTFFSARDFGKHLILSQIVVIAMLDRRTPNVPMHIFQRESEAATFAFINAAKEAAVKKLAEDAKQDISKINMGMTKGLIDIV